MRNLLALLGAAVATFFIVGWFLGWYKFQTTPGPDGRHQIHIDLNSNKIKADLDKGKARLFGLLEAAQQQAAGGNGQTVTPSDASLPTPPAVSPPSLPGLPTPPQTVTPAGGFYREADGTGFGYPPR